MLRRSPFRQRFAAALALATSFLAGQAPAASVVDFAAGPPSGSYSFSSSTPASLTDLLRAEPPPRPPATIVGHLFLPRGTDRVPAVVFMHGSGGVYSAMLGFWPERLNAGGIALLAVDSFGPRGVGSTAENQTLVSYGADVEDAFAALKLLATHPRIDPRRIAVMGTSRGGMTAWRAAVERIIAAERLPGDLRFAAHIPMYSGGCASDLRLVVKPNTFSKVPMLWLHGDADDWTAMAPCRDFAARIAETGTPVEFVVVPGARHFFDSDDPRRRRLRGVVRTKEGCPLETDIDSGFTYDRRSGERVRGDALGRIVREECAAVDATIEGDRGARDFAASRIVEFMKARLKP